MKSFKIALFAVIAALLASPAFASRFEQVNQYEVSSCCSTLEGARASSFWTVDDNGEYAFFDAAVQSWVFDLDNAEVDCTAMAATCEIQMVARDDNGLVVAGPDTFAMDAGDADNNMLVPVSAFTAIIAAGAQDDADDFVQGLPDEAPGNLAVELEIRLVFEDAVQRQGAGAATIETIYKWDGDEIARDQVTAPDF